VLIRNLNRTSLRVGGGLDQSVDTADEVENGLTRLVKYFQIVKVVLGEVQQLRFVALLAV
jgi:hypothetical protein